MYDIGLEHNVELTKPSVKERTYELIHKVSDNGTVDILIDEYDYPLTFNFLSGDYNKSKANFEVLRSFFVQFKAAGPKIGLMWVTGVTKFVETGFSTTVNDIKDISMSREIASLYGYTWEEINKTFGPELEQLMKARGIANEKRLGKIMTAKYHGYSWDGLTRLFNPWDINNVLAAQVFGTYWNNEEIQSHLISLLNFVNSMHYPAFWENFLHRDRYDYVIV